MGERTAYPAGEAESTQRVQTLAASDGGREEGEVDFASRIAARGKMQLWLTAFTAAAAIAVILVVSMSVMRAS